MRILLGGSVGILVSIVAVYYESIRSMLGPFFPPADWPIFRNLTITTTLLSKQLTELNIPAPSVIIEYRVTSEYLADILTRKKLPLDNSDKVAEYLRQLGKQTFDSGEAIERMYSTSNSGLKQLGTELQFIIEKIHPDQVLTRQNETYFAERYGKILNIVTNLRDKFKETREVLDELQIIYNGTRHQFANGMNDVENFFEKFTPVLNDYYDMEQVKRELGYLKRIMEKFPDIRKQINDLLYDFNQHRLALIWCRGEWARLWRRKLVSFKDIETLEIMIQDLNDVTKIFKRNQENFEIRI
ncbi:8755_t:CDS:2 [Diversispora eburnea]|uniref:8755_t:CDS:1 n=1 Tax=Diversispora eburnea TaxID=1213867 RepID=A0A9N8WAP5_9GLOM|nr:8755_t:CDS:2 [Diversispora eburnea]